MSRKPQAPKNFQALLLEPILTPSALLEGLGDDTPDVDDFDIDDFDVDNVADDFDGGDSGRDAIAFDINDVEILPFASRPEFDYTGGVFTVGEDGTVGIDFLFDGGAYRRGEVGIFSLDGLDPASDDFIQLAAERALSNSEQGYVIISDATDGARFSGTMREADFNAGDYRGVREFEMKAGDRFGIMLASNHSIEDVANGKIENVRFSMATDNPNDDFYFGQIADVTGDGNTFAFEDVTLDQSDQDYNDIVFQVRGATAETALMDEVVAEGRDWRTQNMGQALIEYANAYTHGVDYTAADFEAAREFQPLVGVIDTGVNVDAIGLDAGEILIGSDFIDGDDNSLLTDGEGDEHGTQVVSLINTINDDAPLWVGRSVGSGQWVSSLVEFVDAAVESGQPNAIVNLSMDLTQIDADGNVTTRYEFTPMETAALEYARQNNILVAVASGNQAGLMSALGQASQQFDNIITVGAAEQFDPDASNWQGYDRADYSSYGQGLDIMAKGGTQDNPVVGKTGFGSSMATAQVTGAASQVWAVNPDLSYQQVIQILKQTATDLGVANPDLETGAGLLNVAAAVHLAKTIKTDDQTPPLADINPSLTGDDDAIDIDVFPEVVPEEEFQFDDSPINASERAADLWSKTMTLFMGKDWSTEYTRAESWIGKITTNRPRYWTKDAQGRPWEILYTTNGFIIRSAGLGAFAFTWEEYRNRNAWGLFWRSVYARRSRSQILAFKNAYWGQRSWATQTVGSMRRVVGPNGSGWVQEFDGPNGRRLLMLEDGKTEAFWVLGGNYTEYMAMGGLTGMLGFPRSNENKINRADGRYATWQPFSSSGGKSRIHHLSGVGSVATWGSIGSLYTDLGGASHWLGMPTRREYHDGDTIFSDFEGGRIAHNRNTGRTEALRPGQQPSWRQVQSEPGFVNGNVGGVNLNLRSSASTSGSLIGSLSQNSRVTILRSVTGGTYTTPNGQTRSDWYEVEANGKKGYVAAYYVTKGNPPSLTDAQLRDKNLARFPGLQFSTVVSKAINKALDAGGANNSVYPHSSPNSANTFHQWGFHKVGDYYLIINKATGKALDGGGGSNGSLPYIHPDPQTHNSYQLWKLTKVGDAYMIVNKATGRALDPGGNGGNQIYMHPTPKSSNNYHLWKLNLPGSGVSPNPNYTYKESHYLNTLYQDSTGNYISSRRNDGYHNTGRSMDSSGGKANSAIHALVGGEVIEAKNGKEFFGNKVKSHWAYNGTVAIYNKALNKTFIYWHLAEGSINESMKGKTIEPGTFIGKEGNTGYSFGAHTHVEVHNGRVNVNMSNRNAPKAPANSGRLSIPTIFQDAVRKGLVKLHK
ncbi:S8 family serine peptidase [Spirulina major]|uniref:S8 family serine peptidase n=1 Tax=Spirulina major TaxID=270636 RepID=UPI0009349B7C|nr:S8 family serine peptidase [Spirulina major]